ncbi:MAG: WbqC family protein [Nitrospirota bacterium]
MIISIQQPEYFPWLGFYDKIMKVDKVVFLDNVQFKKRYFENRNKVRTAQGWTWITTPVMNRGFYTQKIMDVMIDNSSPWQKKITSTLRRSYGRTPFWREGGEELCELISGQHARLVDLNLAVILFFMDKLGIKREYALASSLETMSSGSDLILEICRKVRAEAYLSGRDGRNYLKVEDFTGYGIEVLYQDFKHPEYRQLHGEFMSHMSITDLYFNHGPGSVEIIRSKGTVTGIRSCAALSGAKV